jgi:hypothetical protein
VSLTPHVQNVEFLGEYEELKKDLARESGAHMVLFDHKNREKVPLNTQKNYGPPSQARRHIGLVRPQGDIYPI